MAGKYKKNIIPIGNTEIVVYATPRVSIALDAVTAEMTVIQGVRLVQVLEAVYEQGLKDGARNAFETLSAKVIEAEKLVPHKNPGRPKARR